MKNRPLILGRKNKDYTQEELANLMDCRKSTVSNWQNGYSMPSLADAFKLSELLDKDINELFSHIKVQIIHTKKLIEQTPTQEVS